MRDRKKWFMVCRWLRSPLWLAQLGWRSWDGTTGMAPLHCATCVFTCWFSHEPDHRRLDFYLHRHI